MIYADRLSCYPLVSMWTKDPTTAHVIRQLQQYFSLFGKPFRKINKGMLVNSINEKDTVAEIEFSIGKLDYKVVRAIKPAKFEIYCNGKISDQESTVVEQQKNLEKNILKTRYHPNG